MKKNLKKVLFLSAFLCSLNPTIAKANQNVQSESESENFLEDFTKEMNKLKDTYQGLTLEAREEEKESLHLSISAPKKVTAEETEEKMKEFVQKEKELLKRSSERFLQNLKSSLLSFYKKVIEQEEQKERMDFDELAIKEFVLNHYCMTEEALNALTSHILIASEKEEIHWNNKEEIILMYYISAHIPNEEKLKVVLEKFQLSKEEFNVYAATVCGEAKKVLWNGKDEPCYVDSTGVATNILGRTNSHKWAYEENVYDQVSRPGQYVVYYENIYQKYMEIENSGYQAALDVLYHEILCKEIGLPLMKPQVWLNFLPNGETRKSSFIQIVPNGNEFSHPQSKKDIIEEYIPKIDPNIIVLKQKTSDELSFCKKIEMEINSLEDILKYDIEKKQEIIYTLKKEQ